MKKRTVWAIVLIILFAIVALVLKFAAPIGNHYLEEKINAEIQKVDGLTNDSLAVSILNRALTFYNIEYRSKDTSIKLAIKEVILTGISFKKLILDDELKIKNIRIIDPIVNYQSPDSNKSKTKLDTAKKAKNKIKFILIGQLQLENGNLNMLANDTLLINQLFGLQVKIDDIQVDQLCDFNLNDVKYGDFTIHSDSLSLLQNELHSLKSKNLIVSKQNGIAVNHIVYFPNENFKNGTNKPSYRVNWTDAAIDSLKLKVNWNELLKNKKLYSSQVEIFQLNYESMLDKNYPLKVVKEKPMPHQLIQNLPFPLHIDSLQLKNSRFQYNERKNGRTDLGKVYFTTFNASIKNISNDSLKLLENPNLNATVETNLMDKSLLNVNINYDLSSTNGNHQIKGRINDFDIRALNEVFLPLALVKFESGHISSMKFNYYLNNTESEGKLDFYYEDLKVIIYKNKHIFKPELLGKLETTLANSVLIRKDNPLRGNYVEGDIQFEREKEKSFLTFWWKSVFSGMASTIMRQK